MTATIFASQLRNWNNESYQSKMRAARMDDFRGIKPISNIELRIKAKEAFERLLDLEVYAMFLTLDAKELLKG